MDAKQFLEERMKVWCSNREKWESEKLSLLPSGDFSDDKGRLHRREHHTAYVTLEDAILAIRMVEEKFLADKETELQRLRSENYTLIKRQEISGASRDMSIHRYVKQPRDILFESILGINPNVKIISDYKSGKISIDEAIRQINKQQNE